MCSDISLSLYIYMHMQYAYVHMQGSGASWRAAGRRRVVGGEPAGGDTGWSEGDLWSVGGERAHVCSCHVELPMLCLHSSVKLVAYYML